MATPLVLNSVAYTAPSVGDAYGTSFTNYLIAIPSAVLQKSGGAFTLTAETDFGGTYGLKSAYFKSRGTAASAGVLRLANTEALAWRNAANGADISLTTSASDRLTFGGVNIPSISSTDTFTGKTMSGDDNTFSNIGYASLDLAGSILDADLAEPISIANGGTGQDTAAEAFNALSPVTTKGDLIAGSGSNTTSRFAVGTDGQVLTANSANATGLGWTSPLTNPMDSAGDIIVGGASGAATKLDAGTSSQVLIGGTSPSWGSVTNAMLAGSIAYSKLTLTGAILNADLAGSIAGSKVIPNFVAQNVYTTGKIGAGNADPQEILHVTGQSSSTGGIRVDGTGLNTGDYHYFGRLSAEGNNLVIQAKSNNSLVIQTGATAATRVTIGSTGLTIAASHAIYLPTADGTAAALDYYERYSASVAYTGPTSGNVTIYVLRIGKQVNLHFSNIANFDSGSSASISLAGAILTRFRPVTDITQVIKKNEATTSSAEPAQCSIGTSGNITLYRTLGQGSFTSGTNYGIPAFTVTWQVA